MRCWRVIRFIERVLPHVRPSVHQGNITKISSYGSYNGYEIVSDSAIRIDLAPSWHVLFETHSTLKKVLLCVANVELADIIALTFHDLMFIARLPSYGRTVWICRYFQVQSHLGKLGTNQYVSENAPISLRC